MAVDRLVHAIDNGNPTIDVFGTVCNMRQYRPNVVPNEVGWILIKILEGKGVSGVHPVHFSEMKGRK